MKPLSFLLALFLLALLAACTATPQAVPSAAGVTAFPSPSMEPSLTPQASQTAGAQDSPTALPETQQPLPPPTSTTVPPTATPVGPTLTPTPDTRLLPRYWRQWPIVPALTGRARTAFELGQTLGADTHVFTRIGDCQSVPDVFLGIYGTERYYFSANTMYLEQTVEWFRPSFLVESVAAKDGFGVASVFSPLLSDPELCDGSETPLECEFRLRQPAFAFIAMGTNWVPNASLSFEKYLRQIVTYSLEHGVVPILVTKADNIEQDYALNESIARIAYEEDVPLYNAWLAVQYLPNHGLDEDNIYLIPDAWDARNFSALETLDALLRDLALLEPRPAP